MHPFKLQLDDYCNLHTTPPFRLLYELERETYLKTLAPQMLSGPLQGTLLQFLSEMIKPQLILEIGTFTGYSALCLAQGLSPEGILHTIDVNPEIQYFVDKYVKKAGLQDKITFHLGNALDIVPNLPNEIDLAFIDAGKQQYLDFYELVLPKLRKGGYLLADNVLWSGKVISDAMDADTLAIRSFNKKIQADERVKNIMLPIRDGLTIVQKL